MSRRQEAVRAARTWSIHLAVLFFPFCLLTSYPDCSPRGCSSLCVFLFRGARMLCGVCTFAHRTRLPGTKLGLVS